MIAISERIGLRHHRPGDITSIFESYTGDTHSARYLARLPHVDFKQTERMLRSLSCPDNLELASKAIWVIESFLEGTPVGLVTVAKSGDTIDVHFGIGVPYRGRGYAAEALSLSARHLLATRQAVKICSFTDVENVAAQTALMKAGFMCLGKVEKYYQAPQLNGESRDVFRYQFRA